MGARGRRDVVGERADLDAGSGAAQCGGQRGRGRVLLCLPARQCAVEIEFAHERTMLATMHELIGAGTLDPVAALRDE